LNGYAAKKIAPLVLAGVIFFASIAGAEDKPNWHEWYARRNAEEAAAAAREYAAFLAATTPGQIQRVYETASADAVQRPVYQTDPFIGVYAQTWPAPPQIQTEAVQPELVQPVQAQPVQAQPVQAQPEWVQPE
jgi:hypothetical protein